MHSMPALIGTLDGVGLKSVKGKKGQPNIKVVTLRVQSSSGNPQEAFDALLPLDGKRVNVAVTNEQTQMEEE